MKIALLTLFMVACCDAATYYVATNGSGVVGSFASPMGLSNAIKLGVSPAVAGDTIFVRGGTYPGKYTVNLVSSGSPIIIRNYNNERAIIDVANETNDVLQVDGSGVWIWGLEITNSNTNRYAVRGGGVGFNSSTPGASNKLINCIVHDTGNAIFVSYQSTNAEVSGCVIYNNGYQGATRGHGHDIYVQNRDYNISKLVHHNIGVNDFFVGMNVRSSFETVNMILRKNVIANSGSTSTNGFYANFHTEGDPMVDQIVFDGNFSYYPSQQYGITFQSLSTNGTISVSNNVWANSYSQIFNWTNVIFNNNTQSVNLDIRADNTNYTTADFNQYWNVVLSVPVSYNLSNYTLANWRAVFGNDSNGTSTASSPSANWVYVMSNPYESGRANVVIYNWLTNDNISVDLSGVLHTGSRYEIRHVPNYGDAALRVDNYAGGAVSFPMTNLQVSVPTGMAVAPTNMAPMFGVFVVSTLFKVASMTVTTATAGTLIAQ